MRYDHPDLQDALAAEYVLGTLRGAARRRLERLLLRHPALRERVHWWERRLSALTGDVAPQPPPRRVWRAVQRRIAGEQRWPRRWWPWPVAAAAASATAVALAFYVARTPVATEPDYLALIENDRGEAVWSIAADLDTARLRARVLNDPAMSGDRVPELWLMPPASGEQPRSLGLLPTEGRISQAVAAALLAGAGERADIAVSAEPPGGSPTGLPTGPVIYQGRLVRL